MSIDKGLKPLREQWEADGEVLFHKESLSKGCRVTLFSFDSHGITWYRVYRYFTFAGEWVTSCDGEFQEERKAWLKLMECFS